ncbi:VCBS domain-containing protein [Vibrio europaeus]|uniref:VCBS domain-containing protein n=1 Tax=Vibrio europaeus TaxID=300876 RepID=UPI00233F33B7|nr:VCBS domain-containing protein [Vibrio europaeus]MDC5853900.1 VCBS domain-containing protein [Vibrio europaeus]
MANKNNVKINHKNTQIKNKQSDERKQKKLRLHSHLKVNIPLFQSLMMILPSLAKHVDASEGSGDLSDEKESATTSSITNKNIVDHHARTAPLETVHQSNPTNENHESAHSDVNQALLETRTHSVPSHHLSTLSHPQVHYIPSVSIPTISAGSHGQPTHSNTPPTPTSPVTFIPEVIKGTYGELHVDVNGQYTFVLNPKSPQYILLNQHQQGTDHFVLHLSNGSSIIVQIPVTGQQDAPNISGDLTGVVTEDHNIDSQGLLQANGKIDVIDPDQGESSVKPDVIPGKYGVLTIDADGHWQYQVNNSLSNVQALTGATSLHESFTIYTKDGTPQTIDMTIGGNDDNAVIAGVDVGSVIEDLTTQVQGQLAVTDPDLGEDHFQASQVNGHLGTLTITKDGAWTYNLDNTNPTVQALGKGSTATDTITVHSADGTPHHITVTINGTNDRPFVSGTSSGAVIEQGLNAAGTPDATGSLIATDIDKFDTMTWAVKQPQGQWGTLSIDPHGHWRYQLDNSTGGAADKLAAGEHQSESFWITATDSAGATVPHKVVIDVQGSNDKPIVSAWTQLPAGKEDQPVTIKASDLLTHASDVDSSDVLHVTNLQATHGSLTDNKDGTYTFTPDKDFNGEIRLTYEVVDGHGGSVSTQAKFDLTAAPDNAIITDAQINADLRGVTEDRGYIDTHYQLHYDGRLNIQDPDKGEAQFDPNIGPQTYQGIGYDTKLGGHILLMRDGHYTYTLDSRNIQNLAQGEVQHDSAVIRSADGTTHTIELTVHGTNDAPTINAQSHSVTEGGSVLNGQMVGQDIDTGATLTYSAPQIDGLVVNPDGSYSFNPAHSSYQSLASGVTKTLTVPVTVTDEHNASSTQNLSITITGVNNSAVIGGVDTGDVTEGNAGQDMSPDYAQPGMAHLVRSTIRASGKLTISDTDTGEAEFDTHGLGFNYSGQYGDLLLRKDGTWFYHADTGQIRSTGGLASTRGTAIDQLGENQTLTDTITVYSKDGTSHDLVITIHGSNDRPYCASEVQLNSGKEDLTQTITATELLANTVDVDANDAGKLTIANLHADHGSIRDNQDGTYTFTPDKDYNGQVHFTYDVKDAHSGVTHTGANMTLAPVGDSATITGTDTGSITEDTHVFPDSMHRIQVVGSLSVSDPDAGEDHFRASGAFGHERAISDPFQGEMHIDRYGNWDYVLANGNPAIQALKQGETKDVIYEVHSADGTPHRITITVTGTNDAPTVSSSVTLAAGKEDTAVTLQASDLLAHASDIDHNAQLSIHNLSADHGQITDNHDGTFRYTPDKDYSGPVQFSYQVQDEHGASVTQTASMNLAAVNDTAQISGVDTGDIYERHAGQDVSPDYAQPGMAKLSNSLLYADGKLNIIDPDPGESAFDTLSSSSVSNNFNYAGQYGRLMLSADGTWHYMVSLGNAPSSGLSPSTATAIDELGQNETLTDTITVHAKDGTTHDIVITIHGDNDAPYVSSQVQLNSGKEDIAQTITAADLLTNAIDVDHNDQGQLSIANLIADHGSVKDNQDGTYTFTPDKDYNGKVHFTYDVKDAHSGVTHTGANMTLASVDDKTTISGVNHGVATEDIGTHMSTNVNIMDAVDWQALQIADIDSPNTQVTVEFAGQRYTWYLGSDLDVATPYGKFQFHTIKSGPHKGEHSWSYVGDNNNTHVQELKLGESLTESVKLIANDGTEFPIQVKINGTEDSVSIDSNSELGHVTENSQAVATVSGRVMAHDVDLHDTVSWTPTSSSGVHGQYGTFHIDSNGQWHYDVDPSKAATLGEKDEYWEHFTIEAISTDGSHESKRVSVVVHGSNDAPTVSPQLIVSNEDQTHTFTASEFGYQDADHDILRHITITKLPAHGLLTLNGTIVTANQQISKSDIDAGHLVFTPIHDQSGTNYAHVEFTANDGHQDSTSASMKIDINAVNDAPTVSEHTPLKHYVNEDANQDVSGQLDISDVDGDTVSVMVDPNHNAQFGQVQFDSHTNTWTYHLNDANPQVDALNHGDTLTDRFTLLIDDGHGGKVSKEIVMTINGHTDPVPYTPPTISVTVDTRNAHHLAGGITASTVQAYAHSAGLYAQRVSGHHEIEGHGHSEAFIVQGSLHEEAELKGGNDILYIGGRLTDEEIEGGSGSDTLILGAYNRNNAPRLHSDKIGNMEIESIENIILGDGTVLKGRLPPNFPSIAHDHYEVPVNIQAHLSSSDESVSSIRLTHLQQGLTLQSNGHNINANQDGSYTVPANGHLVVISAHPISSAHHHFATEVTTHNSVTGVTAVTIEDLQGHIQSHVTPPPPPVQHDEPDLSPLDSVQDFTVTLEDSSSTNAPLGNHAQVSHEHPVGAAAYLDALGIQPTTSPTTGHDQPADMDIVLTQVDQQHPVDYDQAHLDMPDALEHHDAANNHNHNQNDEHRLHNDVDELPDIDPNN